MIELGKIGELAMNWSVNVMAKTVPTICIVMGALLLIVGSEQKLPDLNTWGGNMILIGALLFALPIVLRYAKER